MKQHKARNSHEMLDGLKLIHGNKDAEEIIKEKTQILQDHYCITSTWELCIHTLRCVAAVAYSFSTHEGLTDHPT